MHRSVSPVRNAALWLLALFSGGLALLGSWVILDRLPGMEAVLDDGTATTAQVYGGQSWVLVGAAVLTAGLVGLALTLAVDARAVRPTAAAAAAVESGTPSPASAGPETVDASTGDGVLEAEPTATGNPVPSPR